MACLQTSSLAATLDKVSDAHFSGRTIPPKEVQSVARWIAGRQGLPKSYSDMFAPTEKDYSEGIRLFTGERITSGVAVGHILGEEACRALLLLDYRSKQVTEALERASSSMDNRLSNSELELGRQGFF